MIHSILGFFIHQQLKKAERGFDEACRQVEVTQNKLLKKFIEKNKRTAFGEKHAFSSLHTYADFAKAVPVLGYADLAPWIERMKKGEKNILTVSPLRLFEMTSGSTSENKFIPFTEDFLEEMSSASHAWISNLFTRHPGLRSLKTYASVSPLLREKQKTSGGIPIGIEDDTEYLGRIEALVAKQFLAVPASVAKLKAHDKWQRATCEALIKTSDLGLISVWSPTFLSLLMNHIETHLAAYDLSSLAPRLASGEKLGQLLWPRLKVVSCWRDGPAQAQSQSLTRWFGQDLIQPKGLMATEGVVSIPFGDGDPVLAVNSHFLEFKELETNQIYRAHELKLGNRYTPLLTTGSGFYRYHLKDIIECTGFYKAAPRIRFVGKLEMISDLFGEKLSEVQARECIHDLCQRSGVHPIFSLLTLGEDKKSYDLVIEGPGSERLSALELDHLLRRNVHFDYCRKLGQLNAGKIHVVKDGHKTYLEFLLASGLRLGDIKPTSLNLKHDLIRHF